MRLSRFLLLLLAAGCTTSPPADGDPAAVVEAVTAFENALSRFDLSYVRAHRVEGATVIQDGGQRTALDSGLTAFQSTQRLGVNIEYALRNASAQVSGNVAWATLLLDGTFTATSDSGVVMLRQYGFATLPGHRTFAETYILRRVGSEWHVAHAHSSPIVGPPPDSTGHR